MKNMKKSQSTRGIQSQKEYLTLSRRRPLSYRNQSLNLRSKSMDWFLYDNGLRLERVKKMTQENSFLEFFTVN